MSQLRYFGAATSAQPACQNINSGYRLVHQNLSRLCLEQVVNLRYMEDEAVVMNLSQLSTRQV